MKNIRMFYRLMSNFNLVRLSAFIILQIILATLNILTIFLQGHMLDTVIQGFQTSRFKESIDIIIFILLCAIVSYIINISSEIISTSMISKANISIQYELLKSASEFDYMFYSSKQHTVLLEEAKRFNEWTIKSLFHQTSNIIRTAIGIIGSLCLLLRYSKWFVFFGVFMFIFNYFVTKKFIKNQDSIFFNNIMNNLKYKSLLSALIDKQYMNETYIYQNKDFLWKLMDEEYKGIVRENTKDDKTRHTYDILNEIIMLILMLSYVLMGVIHQSFSSIGQVTITVSALLTFQDSIATIGKELGNMIGTTRLYEKYINYTELAKSQIDCGTQAEIIKSDMTSHISVEDISFKYPNNEMFELQNINFHIPYGCNVAIVGENGSGKSTLIKILLGLYKVERGTVFIDGHSAEIAREQGNLSCIMQSYGKYDGISLYENITMLRGEVDKDRKLVDDYSQLIGTDITETVGSHLGGIDISGGQWQKVSILRALRNNASLAILDEPTAALDPLAEYELFKEIIDTFKEQNTDCVIVTHRLGIARDCDYILVMDRGMLVEQGTHNELMELKGKYFVMFTEQNKWYNFN